MKRNCPNCGAPYEVKLNKCPYCSTSYFDMSCLDMDGHTPCYIKVKTVGTIEMSSDTKDISYHNEVVKRIVTNNSINMNITFEAVMDENRYMMIEV